MCDYSLQTVRSRPARVGDKLTTHPLQYRHYRVRCTRRCQHGGLRSSGNGACLCNRDKVQAATRVVWLDGEYDRPYDGDLPASQ